MLDQSVTSLSLLAQIKKDDRDPQAWRAFVERYGPRIHRWGTQRGLQPADAEDVTQNVLIKLARHLGTFDYEPNLSFRSWLRRITENAIIDFVRSRANTHSESSGVADVLSQKAAREDLVQQLEETFDLEMFELAKARVQARVESRRWRAWELTAVQQLTGEEVAEQLDIKVPTVYSGRYQVQKMIQEELNRLELESDGHYRTQFGATSR